MTRAKTAMMPIFSSAQASERVRGMCVLILYERNVCRVRIGRGAQLAALPSKWITAVLQHDELGFVALLSRRPATISIVRRVAHGLVRRDVERVAQLVRDDDRADVLEVAQLDDLLVDGQSP